MSGALQFGLVDRVTGRSVVVCDPDQDGGVLSEPFVVRERSVRLLAGSVVQHVCELDGRQFVMPPRWVSDCPDNVLPFRRAR